MPTRFRDLIWIWTALCGISLSPAVLVAQQKTAFDVGSKSQLFIDRELVYDARGVVFTQHQAKKYSKEPIFVADQPCEGWAIQLYGTVMYDSDEKLFKMWYDGSASDYFSREVTFYATSKDGIHWDKPPIGTLKSKNGKPHNAVADCLVASVMKDRRDPDPSRRYKMVCYQYDRGYRSMVSPDGLHWREFAPETIVPISYVDDVVTACWSEPHQVFITFPKNPIPVFGRLRRSLFSSTSYDFVHWTKLEPALVADRRDDLGSRLRAERVRPILNYPDNYNVMRTEFYGTGAYAAESCLITFPWAFTVTANVTKIGNHEGPLEVQMAVSRDLVQWERPFRTPIIQPGKVRSAGDADWDSGMFSTAAYAFDYQDEVRLYYYGANFTHGAPIPAEGPSAEEKKKYRSGVGLATWKKDRFVSVDATKDPSGGVLTTVPVRFSGQRLEVNANVKDGGSIVVELLDVGLRPRGASFPITGDSLKHDVRFIEETDLSKLAGQPIVLRFRMVNAELYAFAFRK